MSGGAERVMALRERVVDELLSCYGEDENTDWPYLNDLADLIVGIVQREAPALLSSDEGQAS